MPPKKQPARSETAPPPPAVPAPASNEGDLPEGWAVATVRDVLTLINGCPFKPTQWKQSGLPIIRIQNLNNPNAPYNYCDEAVAEKFRVRKEDLLFAWSGTPGTSFGAHIWQGGDAWLNQHIFRIEFDPHVFDRSFLKHAINQNLDRYISAAHGGAGLAHITKGEFDGSTVVTAPLAEQRRIVGVLEGLLGKVAASRERLARVPQLLKRFRQSVLAAACSGKLTADWREGYGLSSNYTSASLDEVSEYIGGFAYPSPRFAPTGNNQVIRIGNVRPMQLDITASPVFIDDDLAKETERFRLRLGDIVVSMTGTKYKRDYGNAALVDHTHGSLYLNQRVSRVRCGEKIQPRFLLYWMQSDLFRQHFFAGETGNVNQGNVGADGIRKAPIEIPPLAEQHEIVRRVEQLFALADRLEAQLDAARKRVDRLTQSILAKAFRGELVPTEADLARREGRTYEPASELLARIRQQQTSNQPAKEKRKTTRKTAE
jgi:type I restriction enzyme S subunit